MFVKSVICSSSHKAELVPKPQRILRNNSLEIFNKMQ
ncbi:SLEI motif protein [Leptospira interrogans]|nr:SLEI motif protein [Leptospira interrogans serovar Canicola]TQE56554.1 SLEI motif protein [Leptospira interrogans]ASV10039.1 SLEI motif protein [Leptospira interrogans serovar Canicola]TQE61982.1 SLEI motif protein [Leptospira interrogans]TQE66127.1 SLEI motif protein [Leptospira interrogans]